MEDQRAEEIWFENEWRSGRDPSQYGGCQLIDNIHLPPPVYPFMNLFAFSCACGAMQKREHKKDCFFFREEHHMGATIPTCSYNNGGLDVCPCESCNKYISRADVYKLAVSKVDETGE